MILREAFERQGTAFCVSLGYVIVNSGFEGIRKGVGFSTIHDSKCFLTDWRKPRRNQWGYVMAWEGFEMETTEWNPKTHPVYPVCNICTVSKVFNICFPHRTIKFLSLISKVPHDIKLYFVFNYVHRLVPWLSRYGPRIDLCTDQNFENKLNH